MEYLIFKLACSVTFFAKKINDKNSVITLNAAGHLSGVELYTP